MICANASLFTSLMLQALAEKMEEHRNT